MGLLETDSCAIWHSDYSVSIYIRHINDKLPTDLVTLVANAIQICTKLKKVNFDSISNDTNDLLLLDAVVTSTKIEEIYIETFPISEVIIPKILNESKSLKELKVGPWVNCPYDDYPGRYAFEWCCFKRNRNSDDSDTVIRIKHINDKLPTELVTPLTNLIQNCATLKEFICDSISNDTNDLLLLDAVVANTKNEKIEIGASRIKEVIIPKILNKSKSLKELRVGWIEKQRYDFAWCCNQDQSANVTLHKINNITARFYANFFPKINVRNFYLYFVEYQWDSDAPLQLMHFIQTSESLESIQLWESNERVIRELLKAAAQNVNMTNICANDVPPIKDLIPTLLETSKSLRRLEINRVIYYECRRCRRYGDGEASKQYVHISSFNNDTDRICGKLLQEITVTYLEITGDDVELDDAP